MRKDYVVYASMGKNKLDIFIVVDGNGLTMSSSIEPEDCFDQEYAQKIRQWVENNPNYYPDLKGIDPDSIAVVTFGQAELIMGTTNAKKLECA